MTEWRQTCRNFGTVDTIWVKSMAFRRSCQHFGKVGEILVKLTELKFWHTSGSVGGILVLLTEFWQSWRNFGRVGGIFRSQYGLRVCFGVSMGCAFQDLDSGGLVLMI